MYYLTSCQQSSFTGFSEQGCSWMLKQLVNAKSMNLHLSSSNSELSGMVMDLCAWDCCLAQNIGFIEIIHVWGFFL